MARFRKKSNKSTDLQKSGIKYKNTLNYNRTRTSSNK